MIVSQETLIKAAREVAKRAYAPYSQFRVGAALAFADGTIFTGANVENASYGLTLCAETAATASAMNAGHRGGLISIAIVGSKNGRAPLPPVTPCGRCRQVLSELAQLGGTDPVVWCASENEVLELKLSKLLPHSFGPATLK